MEAISAVAIIESMKSRGGDVYVGTPASEAAVELLEHQMGVPLPPDVWAYLRQFGCISIGDIGISGIVDNRPLSAEGGNILNDTAQLRAAEPELPLSLWVISAHEDGAYCLDYSAGAEPVVVNFERGQATKVSESFAKFVADYLQVLGR